MKNTVIKALCATALAVASQPTWAACNDVTREQLLAALGTNTAKETTGGYGLKMWITMVDETGKVCHVITDGTEGELAGNSEWLGSRIISAQKANTANAFSLNGYAISTANLYSAVQPGGSLFGLQHSNPVDAGLAYLGNPKKYGTNKDPLIKKRVGGVNVFGGGLALYKGEGEAKVKIGAIGVSGDTSCRDHEYAWNVRKNLIASAGLANPPGGITTSNMNEAGTAQTSLDAAAVGDEMILDISDGDTTIAYWDAWSQPTCPNSTGDAIATVANGVLKN